MPAHNIRFLVVEPDAAVQQEVYQAVTEIGYGAVRGVADVRQALIALVETEVDFVICDWSDDAGPEIGFVKLLKGQETTRFIPVLLTMPARFSGQERIRRTAAAGVDGVLFKPFERQQLKGALDEILAKSQTL